MEVKLRTAQTLVSKLSSVSEQTRSEALKELRLITKHDADSHPLVAEADAIPYLVESLFGSSPAFQDDAAATPLNISISCRHNLISKRGLLDAISHALCHHGSPTSSATAVQSSAATPLWAETLWDSSEGLGKATEGQDLILFLGSRVLGGGAVALVMAVGIVAWIRRWQ